MDYLQLLVVKTRGIIPDFLMFLLFAIFLVTISSGHHMKNNNRLKISSLLGFSLVELSVVMVIIGVLVSITLSMGIGQIGYANGKSSGGKLDRIEQALSLYLKNYNSLPCPANGTLAITNSSFGIGNKTNAVAEPPNLYNNSNCPNANFSYPSTTPTMYAGTVPTRDLGLPDDYAFDAWGNRYTYAVSKYCVDPDNWAANNTYKCSASTGSVASSTTDGGSITVEDLTTPTANIRALSGTPGSTSYLPGAAYVVLSHGKDGIGAFTRAGRATRVQGTANTLEDDNSHLTTTYDSTYRDGMVNDGSNTSKYFDDIVRWKTAGRVWDDSYGSSAMPPCVAGQSLVSNGGNTYSCADYSNPTWPTPSSTYSDDLVNWNYSKSNFGSVTPSAVPITTTGRKFISLSTQCITTALLGTSSTTLDIIFKDSSGNVLSDHVVCSANILLGALASNMNTGSIFLPIPSTAATTTIQPKWTSVTTSSDIRAKWYLY